MKDRQKDAICLLAIVLIIVAVFWPVVCGRATLVPTDILHQMKLPFGAEVTHLQLKNHFQVDAVVDGCNEALYFQRCVRAGQCPIWTPVVWCGMPYYAVSTLSFACPFQMVCWSLLPMPAGYDWSVMLQFMAAGVFMYLLLRFWRLAFLACLLGSLAYCLNTVFIFRYWHATFRAFVWMPVVILFFDRAMRTNGWRYGVISGFFAALALISGSIQTAIYVLLLLGIYAGATALVRRKELKVKRVVSVAALAGMVAVLLAAFQVLPTLELMSLDASGRTAGESTTFLNRLGAVPFLSTFVVPSLWGSTESFDLFKAIQTDAGEFQGYIGIASFALLLLAVAAWREPQVKVLTLCAVCVVALLIFVPFIRARLYYRFFVAYVFAAAGLAAWGLDHLLQHIPADHMVPSERRLRKTLWMLAILLGVVTVGILAIQTVYAVWSEPLTRFSNRIVAQRAVGTLTGFTARGTDWLKTRVDDFWKHYRLTNPSFWVPLAIGGAAIAVALARLRGRLQRSCGFIFVGLVIIDLATTTWRLMPMIDLKTYPLYPHTAQTEYLQQSAARVYHWPTSGRGILDVDILMAYGVQSFDADGSMWPLTMCKLLKDAGRVTNAAALGMCAVTHVLSNTNEVPTDPAFELVSDQDGVRIYRNTMALPRARFVARYLRAANLQECRRIMARPDWEPQSMPIIETDRQPATESRTPVEPARVRIVTEQTTEVEIAVQTEKAGYVLLADTFYPGWQASVDDHPATICRANGAQRAVFVEPGEHRVRFRYAPASIRLGVAISISTLIVVVALGLWHLGRCGKRSASI
ncbi:MAG: YfhO family protein [Verrucomicrobiia bacterium]